MCGWIKGIYGICLENPDIKTIVAVVRGDCSNAQALMETLSCLDREVIPFAYPYDRDRKTFKREVNKFINFFNTDESAIKKVHRRLNLIRKKLNKLDKMTWQDMLITGFENHNFLVNSSDFNGAPDTFEKKLDNFLETVYKRFPFTEKQNLEKPVRLGYIGVPPIIIDFYERFEALGANIVYNEVQRQFSMPGLHNDILDQYLDFTYPYDIFFRLQDIEQAIKERKLDGLIHYTQSFCFRQIEDIIIRRRVNIPVLTIEGERPVLMDARTLIRVETFIEMLREI